MFERFVDSARRVLVLARDEAYSLGHDFIGTEHLLLGLAAQTDSPLARVLSRHGLTRGRIRSYVCLIAGRGASRPRVDPAIDAEALATLGIDLDEVRRRVEETFGAGALAARPPGKRQDCSIGPLTPRAKQAFELALRATGRRSQGRDPRHRLTQRTTTRRHRPVTGGPVASNRPAARRAAPQLTGGLHLSRIRRRAAPVRRRDALTSGARQKDAALGTLRSRRLWCAGEVAGGQLEHLEYGHVRAFERQARLLVGLAQPLGDEALPRLVGVPDGDHAHPRLAGTCYQQPCAFGQNRPRGAHVRHDLLHLVGGQIGVLEDLAVRHFLLLSLPSRLNRGLSAT